MRVGETFFEYRTYRGNVVDYKYSPKGTFFEEGIEDVIDVTGRKKVSSTPENFHSCNLTKRVIRKGYPIAIKVERVVIKAEPFSTNAEIVEVRMNESDWIEARLTNSYFGK